MIEGLIYLVLYILIIGIVLSLLEYIIQAVPIFAPFQAYSRMVLTVVGCLILILLLLQFVRGGGVLRLP
jgi:hypothetical protein